MSKNMGIHNNQKKPTTISLPQLIEPANNAHLHLTCIIDSLDLLDDKYAIRGLFVLGLTYFESMFTDTLKYYLSKNPRKLTFGKIDLKEYRGKLLDGEEIFPILIERQIRKLSYGNIENLLKTSLKMLDIEDLVIQFENIIEIKGSRNILIHNNMIVNDSYLSSVGGKARGRLDESVRFDKQYVIRSLGLLQGTIDTCRARIQDAYKNYTRLKLFRDLWDYLFDSPMLIFDNYWKTDKEEDKIIASKKARNIQAISTSERIFLGILKADFNGNMDLLEKSFSPKLLDEDNIKKYKYLIGFLKNHHWS